MSRFKDKVVLVTGGNRNTGLWVVKKFVDIECHGRFDLPTALRVCNALEEYDPYWVEEPVIPDTMRALADLRSRVKVQTCVRRTASGTITPSVRQDSLRKSRIVMENLFRKRFFR